VFFRFSRLWQRESEGRFVIAWHKDKRQIKFRRKKIIAKKTGPVLDTDPVGG
jgi:hypothetical protein